MKIIETKDVTTIRPLHAPWMQMMNGKEFGIMVDPGVAEERLRSILESGEGTILVAYKLDDDAEDVPVGFFAVISVPSFFGEQKIALELLWFALPNAMTAGPRLLKAAMRWTEEHGCSHLMLSGSRLSSDMHDKVCEFCEKVGAKPFETVYLLRVS